VSVSIEIIGADGVADKLRAAGARLDQPLDSLLQLVADVWTTDFQSNFEREGTVGGPWVELAPLTQRLRKARGFGADHPILRRTGDLLHSIGIVSQGAEEVAVGTTLRYASILQDGGIETYHLDVPGERTIPPRPFIELREELLADTEDLIDAFFFGEEADA
jgi:phage gpG-like protein